MLMSYEYCMLLDFDSTIMNLTLDYKGAVIQKMLNKPSVDPVQEAYKIQKRWIERKSKDLY